MATKNIVPRADSEGQIGTSLKRWLKGVFVNLLVTGAVTDGFNITSVSEIRQQIDFNNLMQSEIDFNNLEGV
jgi:hypothetical protein